MDPASLNPIMPALSAVGPSLLGPLIVGGLVAIVGMLSVVVLVARSLEPPAPAHRRTRASILDGVARSMVEGRRSLRVDSGSARSST